MKIIANSKPKYQALKEYLTGIIRQETMKPGERILSENELAYKFEISRHTVRQAVGELVSEGWLYRIKGKGTFVDRRPDRNPPGTKNVGVMTTYLNDYIFPSIIRGIDNVMNEHGYNIMLACTYNRHEKERSCLNGFLKKPLDGLIVEATKSALPNPNLDLYREISAKGIPVLFIHGFYNDLNYSYIVEDDVKAGYMAAMHLIDMGHKNIGGIFKVDDIQGHNRFKGYQNALKSRGLDFSDNNVVWFDTGDMEAGPDIDNHDGIKEMLDLCTGLLCYNDQLSIRIIDNLRSRNLKIPENKSLVSFDDSEIAVASYVKLTTVAHPKEKLGRKAANSMLDMINGEKKFYGVKMKPHLVIRSSTYKPCI